MGRKKDCGEGFSSWLTESTADVIGSSLELSSNERIERSQDIATWTHIELVCFEALKVGGLYG
jgi:hypothetical protein